MPIPLVDVKAQYAPLTDALRAQFDEVLERGQFIRGANFYAFEEEAAEYLGVSRTIGVANGTDALVLVLDALGIGPGDEVICPAFTFYATAESIARRGATPVLADIDPATLNLDAEDVARRVTKRTRAIMPVHLFGRPAPVATPTGVTVRFVLTAPDAREVTVAGTFNQWDSPATPLVRTGSTGIWTATITLPAGQHQYAFVVDGQRWVASPANFFLPVKVLSRVFRGKFLALLRQAHGRKVRLGHRDVVLALTDQAVTPLVPDRDPLRQPVGLLARRAERCAHLRLQHEIGDIWRANLFLKLPEETNVYWHAGFDCRTRAE